MLQYNLEKSGFIVYHFKLHAVYNKYISLLTTVIRAVFGRGFQMRKHPNRKYPQANHHRIFSTQKKIILNFFLVVIIVFLIFNTVFIRLYSANIRQIVINESKSVVKKTNEFLNRTLESMEYIADIVQNNPTIQRILGQYIEEPATRYKMYRDTMETLQSIATNSIGSAESVDVYISREGHLITSDYGLFSDLEWADKKYYEMLQEIDSRFLLTDTYRRNLTFMINRNYQQITLVRPIYLLSEGQKAGVVAINIDIYDLKAIIEGNSFSASMIVDDNNHILAETYPDPKAFTTDQFEAINARIEGDEGVTDITINNKAYIIVYERSGYTGWRYISIVPANTSNAQMSGLRDTILILFLLMSFISAVLLIVMMSDKVYRRIRKLILSMEEVENGNFNVSIKHGEHDEFGYMYSSFNNMVSKIRSLFGELYEQKLLQKEAELKLLQSKINPHFIYNIFDNMNWLIQLKRFEELEVLVDSVSSYYKKSLNAGKDFITVSDTLDQLKNYVQIQQIRFKNRFDCEFDFDPDITDMLIPNFILQPLLENAICHGIEPKTEKGHIFVKGIHIDDRVFFTVEDNGVGISIRKLQDIISYLKGEKAETDNFFALANINKRIKIHYGEAYGLTVKSSEGEGTKVTVFIPTDNCKEQEA